MQKRYASLVIVAMILSCCSRDEQAVDTILPEESLSVAVAFESSTRGTMVYSEADMGSLGLYCAYTKDLKWDTDTEFDRMNNEQLNYNSTSASWEYKDGAPTWGHTSVTDRYTFMAYSPHDALVSGIEPSLVDGSLVVDYEVPQECEDQLDLMMAVPRKDIYPQIGGVVSLTFKHTLASIGFSVKGSEDDIISDITIRRVVSSGRVAISDEGEVTWSYDRASRLSYSAKIEEVKPDISTAKEITTTDGYLMMIPQSCRGVEIDVTTYNSSSRDYTTKTIELSDDDVWEAGKSYDYTINTSSYDYTIDGTSNCYMLQPNGEEQTFYIPVEGRINTFWRDYADDSNRCEGKLSSSDAWSATLLWSDVSAGMNNFSVERVTSGFSSSDSSTSTTSGDFTTSGCCSAMKIVLPYNIVEANILVAVEFNGEILWSWHLWITEYNPSLIAERSRATRGKYVYTVEGVSGEVHRYDNDDLWETLYDDRFIMDRNLGARSTDYATNRDGVLHYQFGRKDPFPAKNSISVTTEDKCVSFAEAVQNPTTFYIREYEPYSWSEEGLSMSNYYLWFDESVQNDPDCSGKSFFDPSPLGWRVPRYGTFTVMNDDNCEYDDDNRVVLYNGVVKLPMTGYRSNKTGNINDYGSQGSLRLSTQIDESYACNLVYNPDIQEKTNNTIADGFCIRCIEE